MNDPYKNLAEAIVSAAFEDYRNLTMFLKHHPDNYRTHKELKKLKEFIFSHRFKAITDINPDYMLKKIDEFVKGDCKKCISVGIS